MFYIRDNKVFDYKSSLSYDDETLYAIDAPEIQAILNPAPTTERLEQQASATRDAAIDADIEYNGVMFQANEKAEININRVLSEVYRNPELESETRQWRASDNSWHPLTPQDLRNIMSLKTQRMDEIFSQFTIWDSGSKDAPFEIT